MAPGGSFSRDVVGRCPIRCVDRLASGQSDHALVPGSPIGLIRKDSTKVGRERKRRAWEKEQRRPEVVGDQGGGLVGEHQVVGRDKEAGLYAERFDADAAIDIAQFVASVCLQPKPIPKASPPLPPTPRK